MAQVWQLCRSDSPLQIKNYVLDRAKGAFIQGDLKDFFFQFFSVIHHCFFNWCALPSQVKLVPTAWSVGHQVALVRQITSKWEPLDSLTTAGGSLGNVTDHHDHMHMVMLCRTYNTRTEPPLNSHGNQSMRISDVKIRKQVHFADIFFISFYEFHF